MNSWTWSARSTRPATAVVLVEQSVNVALNLAEHAYFMEKGQIRFDGSSRDLLAKIDLLRAVFLSGASSRRSAGRGHRGALMTSRDTMAGLLRRLPARSRLPLGCGAVLALGLPFAHALGYATPPYVVVLGAIIGIGYGLLGVCLVLVFRTSQVINFALPQIGIFAAASLPVFVQVAGLPYWWRSR